MRIVIARTMPNFSMDVYADGLISGLRAVRPNWEIIELAPRPIDRRNSSLFLRLWKYYERFWHFPRKVKHQVGDIFHIIDHSEAHIVHWLKNTNKPVVVTCHDLINFFYHENLKGSVQLPLVSNGTWMYSVRAMQYANHIITVSSETAKDTTQILNIEPARIAIIPNAVESIFKQLAKKEFEFLNQKYRNSPETLCLLNVGGDFPRKNIDTILEVVKILEQRGLSVQLWKAGADFTKEQKEYVKNQKLENSVKYLGKPDKSTLVKIYNAADILIAPSLHEGFGITILEAMACGTPVITSNVSAMPEVAGDAGILVAPQDCQAIADAVSRLHSDPVYYQELVAKGLARTKSFTWNKTAEQIAEIYENLVFQKPSIKVAAKT